LHIRVTGDDACRRLTPQADGFACQHAIHDRDVVAAGVSQPASGIATTAIVSSSHPWGHYRQAAHNQEINAF